MEADDLSKHEWNFFCVCLIIIISRALCEIKANPLRSHVQLISQFAVSSQSDSTRAHSTRLNTSSSFCSVIIFHPAQERRLNYRAHGERHPSTSWLNGIMNQVPKHFCRWWRQRKKSRQQRVKINTRVNWAGARLWQFIVPAKLERSAEILDFTLTFNEQWSGRGLMLRNRQWIVAGIIEWHLWLQSAPENELLWIKSFFHAAIAHAIRCLSLDVNRLIGSWCCRWFAVQKAFPRHLINHSSAVTVMTGLIHFNSRFHFQPPQPTTWRSRKWEDESIEFPPHNGPLCGSPSSTPHKAFSHMSRVSIFTSLFYPSRAVSSFPSSPSSSDDFK